jgi:hypothetical protein
MLTRDDLSDQEQPHADLAGIELLLHVGEVVLEVRRVAVGAVAETEWFIGPPPPAGSHTVRR